MDPVMDPNQCIRTAGTETHVCTLVGINPSGWGASEARGEPGALPEMSVSAGGSTVHTSCSTTRLIVVMIRGVHVILAIGAENTRT